MGKKVIITEKPSVAAEFARVLSVAGKNKGYIENESWIITWCVGHLVALVYPEKYDEKYKKWNIKDLPFLPETYKYGIISDVREQYNTVYTILHREDVDIVYWAGDSGREGQVIEENIRRFGGLRKGITELRVWIDSQTEDEIRRGLREAKPMSAYDNLAASGVMRAIEDYAMGINFSRVLTCRYGNMLNSAAALAKYTPISVGRVMTCVLGMVVRREREIRDFKVTSFYKLSGNFGNGEIVGEWKAGKGSKYYESPLLYNETGFRKLQDAENLCSTLKNGQAVVEHYESTESKKKAPMLFNLAELQSECTKKFKISPDETLKTAQSLYEKKLTTYPRTDARVLSTAISIEIHKNIEGLKSAGYLSEYCERILNERLYAGIKSYVDDSKITDHYAIIPTGNLENHGVLTELEKKIYDLIVRRFLSIFFPPAVYSSRKLVIKIENETFHASQKSLVSPGYLVISGNYEDEETGQNTLPELKKGTAIAVKNIEVKEGKTSPPKRYTSGSMILAMENAGNLIEDEELRAQIKGAGIGTSATRAETLKKLITIGHISSNPKTQVLTPNPLGEMIYEVVYASVPELLNPKLTAEWDRDLRKIEEGTYGFNEYRNKLEVYIRENVVKIAGQDRNTEIVERIRPFAKGKITENPLINEIEGINCPECNGKIKITKFGYCCENYKKDTGCTFAVSGEICGKKVSPEDIKKIIKNGKTELIKGFKSKNGKEFEAYLAYKDKKVAFEFEQIESTETAINCPKCGEKLIREKYSLKCGCGFKMPHTICDKELGDAEIRQLLEDKRTGLIRGFKSKKGSKFNAYLVFDDNYNVNFEFETK